MVCRPSPFWCGGCWTGSEPVIYLSFLRLKGASGAPRCYLQKKPQPSRRGCFCDALCQEGARAFQPLPQGGCHKHRVSDTRFCNMPILDRRALSKPNPHQDCSNLPTTSLCLQGCHRGALAGSCHAEELRPLQAPGMPGTAPHVPMCQSIRI